MSSDTRRQRYQAVLRAVQEVRRRNRLTTARKLGCDVKIAHFTGPGLADGARYVFGPCGALDESYISDEVADALKKRNRAHVWAAIDREGRSRGYAIGYRTSLDGAPAVKIEILCAEPPRGVPKCPHLAIHIVRRIEKDARRLGARVLHLEALTSVVRFYRRIGFQVTSLPCRDQARARAERNAYDTEMFRLGPSSLPPAHRLRLFLEGRANLTNAQLRNIAAYGERAARGPLVPMSKCLRE